MTGKTQSKPRKNAEPTTASSQMWALNPVVNLAGMLGWSEVMRKSVQFVSERVEQDLQFQRDILKCNSLEELLHLQSAFYHDALEQYTKQYQRVTEILSETTALGLSEVTTPRSRAYDDIPL